MADNNIAGNFYDKYNSRNPIVRLLMHGFYNGMGNLLTGIKFENVLDTGCGEGYLIHRFFQPDTPSDAVKTQIAGIDIAPEILRTAKKYSTAISFLGASVYALPFKNNSFDMVVANEVLEHLDDPQLALTELDRVGRRFFLFSVPREPLWRLLNMCRFRYLNYLGNTPGHLRHWSKKSFMNQVASIFDIIRYEQPLPWTMVLCRKRNK